MQAPSSSVALAPPPTPALSPAPLDIALRPHWSDPGTPFRHTWEGVVNIDQFRWLVRRDVQEQIALAHRELGARHVRAVGMFDDELRVFCPGPEGFGRPGVNPPRTNWQIVDYIIDSLAAVGCQPMFTTSFIPSAMAGGSSTVFTTKGHTSPPRDWHEWERFVTDAVVHAVDRYGLVTVRQWYFEVWNEPNLVGWFWGGDQAAFLQLWATTYRAIKNVDASLCVGGPSTAKAEWIEDLLAYGDRHDCRPDYLIAHIYNNDSVAGQALAPFDGAPNHRANNSADFAAGVIRGVRRLAQRTAFSGEIHWNEWGRFYHAVEQRRESPCEPAFIARTLAAVSQEADRFAYWCLSDIYDQVGYGREAFYGGYGLLSLQSLRKPSRARAPTTSSTPSPRSANVRLTCLFTPTSTTRRRSAAVSRLRSNSRSAPPKQRSFAWTARRTT
jgi:xylan 1,4-beta-xylosidase